jgi:TonB family protein
LIIAPFLVNRLRLPLDWLTYKMASVMTSDFVRTDSRNDALPFSMIEQKGLIARLAEELLRASREMARDPRGFIRNLLFDGAKDTKRRRLIRIGLLCALAAHLALIGIIVVLGWNRTATAPVEEQTIYTVTMVPPTAHNPHGQSGASKGEDSRGKNDGGGGGGGQNNPLPASGGALPKMAPAQQVVHPLAPTSPSRVMPIPATIVGPQSAEPPPNVALGIPTGQVDAPPSPGSGTGGGIGSGKGTGAGSGDGPGAGPGRDGGSGGGGRLSGEPNGTGSVPGILAFNDPQKPSGFSPFTWTYRPTPIVTPEAQANKVSGTVLLRATFSSNGVITDIEIVNPVPFMTDSAVEALRRSRFRPATVNGKPVTLVRVPVRINVHY